MSELLENAFVHGQYDERKTVMNRTQTKIMQALEVLGYKREAYELLNLPLAVINVRFPVMMDDGGMKVFTGFRSQHNDAVGPFKGGIRFHPEITQHEVEELSISMSIKSGIAGIPFGGGKGAILCDPRDLSFAELERVSRGFVRAISQVVGPAKDVPAPDVFANAQNMAWMVDEYSRLSERDMPGFMTGKPLILGGTQGRENVASRCVAICLTQAAAAAGISIAGARVIVQGFENIGSSLAKFLCDTGAKVVGVSDSYGALYQPGGLNINELLEKRDSFGTVTKLYQNKVTYEELLESDCDILVLSGANPEISSELASKIRTSVIVEASSQLISDEIEHQLAQNGVLIVPDILANLGPSIISYLEWVQNQNGYYWTGDEVLERLTNLVQKSFASVHKAAKKYKTDLRLAAYIVGVERFIVAAQLRAWI